jgi:hypothetical protein
VKQKKRIKDEKINSKLLIFSFFGVITKAYCDDLDEEINLKMGLTKK